jgi:hypothetical protein
MVSTLPAAATVAREAYLVPNAPTINGLSDLVIPRAMNAMHAWPWDQVRDQVIATRSALYAADGRFSPHAIGELSSDSYEPRSLHCLEGSREETLDRGFCRGVIRLTFPGADGRLPFQDKHTSWAGDTEASAEVGRYLVDPAVRGSITSVRLLQAVAREAMHSRIQRVFINVATG